MFAELVTASLSLNSVASVEYEPSVLDASVAATSSLSNTRMLLGCDKSFASPGCRRRSRKLMSIYFQCLVMNT